MARNLLITGGAGFIGANFVHYWRGAHPDDRVVVLDLLTYAGNLASLRAVSEDAQFRFERGDICDEERVASLLREERIDTLVHFAAESHVDRSIAGPDAFIRTNVLGTHALLKAARRVWLQEGGPGTATRFHHVSTDEVYGSLGPEDPPFTERTHYAPNSPYAASKAASDHLVRAYHHTYGLPVTTSNCSNNYGPYHFPEKLIPLTLVNALDGKALPIYGDGKNIRDWLYVEDHCRGIEAVLLHGCAGEAYNLGGGNERTNTEVVRALCAAVDTRFAADGSLRARFPDCPASAGTPTASLIRFVADRPGHDRRYAIDDTRAQRELGWAPSESFDSGIGRTLAWFLGHERWWRPIQSGAYREWVEGHYGALPAL
jgi:dTDP-glucose 4,6-dehydratase